MTVTIAKNRFFEFTDGGPVQRSNEIDKDLFALVQMGQADEDFVLVRGVLKAGIFLPLHSHGGAEAVHVIDGTIEVYLDDQKRWFTVQSNESIVISSNVRIPSETLLISLPPPL